MTQGRKRVPRALHVLKGNAKKARQRKEPNFPVVTELSAPDWLVGPDARSEWDRLVGLLRPTRVLTEGDVANLGHYCNLHAELVRRYRTWLDPEAASEEVTAPMIAQLRMFASEFGLTPASRSKVAPAEGAGETNPFKVLGGKEA